MFFSVQKTRLLTALRLCAGGHCCSLCKAERAKKEDLYKLDGKTFEPLSHFQVQKMILDATHRYIRADPVFKPRIKTVVCT